MSSVTDIIFGIIGTLLYSLFAVFFSFIDGLFDIFKAFAGVGPMRFGGAIGNTGVPGVDISAGNSGELTDTGIVYYLLQQSVVKNLIVSIALLGLFLLIIFTVMAFIKNAYAAKQKTWQEILSNALKGLANFVILPVGCLFGVWASNILLNAIDGATSGSGSSLTMAGRLFKAAAYDANEVRQGESKLEEAHQLCLEFAADNDVGFSYTVPLPSSATEEQLEDYKTYIADKIDELYATDACDSSNIGNPIDVSKFYQLASINYLVLLVGGIFMCYVLVSLAYGMIRRMFFVLILFVISPGLCSMYPLDEGKATGQWKSDFQKNVISAYGAIAGMNLFYAILPLVLQIRLVGAAGEVLNAMGITELIILVSGLMLVKEFISKISGYIGADNAFADGAALRSGVKSKIKEQTKKTGAFVMGAASIVSSYRDGKGNRSYQKKLKEQDWLNKNPGKTAEDYKNSRLGARIKNSRAVQGISERLQSAGTAIGNKATQIKDKFGSSKLGTAIKSAGSNVGGALGTAGRKVKNAGGWVSDRVKNVAGEGTVLGDVIGSIKGSVKRIGITDKFLGGFGLSKEDRDKYNEKIEKEEKEEYKKNKAAAEREKLKTDQKAMVDKLEEIKKDGLAINEESLKKILEAGKDPSEKQISTLLKMITEFNDGKRDQYGVKHVTDEDTEKMYRGVAQGQHYNEMIANATAAAKAAAEKADDARAARNAFETDAKHDDFMRSDWSKEDYKVVEAAAQSGNDEAKKYLAEAARYAVLKDAEIKADLDEEKFAASLQSTFEKLGEVVVGAEKEAAEASAKRLEKAMKKGTEDTLKELESLIEFTASKKPR